MVPFEVCGCLVSLSTFADDSPSSSDLTARDLLVATNSEDIDRNWQLATLSA